MEVTVSRDVEPGRKSGNSPYESGAIATGAVCPVRTFPQPACRVCGGAGEIAYSGLRDRLFGVLGEWTLRRCADPDCGLLWLDPMPVEADLPKLYGSYYTHQEPVAPFAKSRFREAAEAAYLTHVYGYPGASRVRSRLVAMLLKLSPGHRAQTDLRVFGLYSRPGARLLDIGCGSGGAMQAMRSLGWVVEGVDFDEQAVKRARRRGLQVNLGAMEEQRYPSDRFDAVVMNHVLEHVSDPQALLRECRRVLKPGRLLVCVTPNAKSCHSVYRSDWRGLEPPRHLQIFTPASLSSLARASGWTRFRVTATVASTHSIALHSKALSDGRENHAWSGYERAAARALQMTAALASAWAPAAGDELVLRATKV